MKRYLYRLVPLILIMVVLLGLAAPIASATAPFSDVTYTALIFDAAWWAHEEGLVTGTNGRFLPNDPMTRAQYALILYRYEGSPPVTTSGAFTDVPSTRPSYHAVTWANANGIVTGSGGSFLPDDSMTRAQMILMMHRYSALKGFNTSANLTALDPFADRSQVSAVAAEAMAWGVANGLITGDANNRLLPNGTITRAQVVLILHRYVTKFVGAPANPPPSAYLPPPLPELPAELEAFANEVFRLINIERDRVRLPPLRYLPSLTDASQVRANEIVTHFSHTRPNGGNLYSVLREHNVRTWAREENLARHIATADEVVQSWLDSPTHRAILLHRDMTHMGIGIARDTHNSLHVVQVAVDYNFIYDYYDDASARARSRIISHPATTRAQMIEWLQTLGFTMAQSVHGANEAGL